MQVHDSTRAHGDRLRPARQSGRRQSASREPRNPVASTPESIAAGKRAYDLNCAACHGNVAQGVKAGIAISIIEEQKGRQAPDLTDAQWDHGSTDGEIYAAIKRGLPPTMMAGFDGRISDDEIWSIVNYARSRPEIGPEVSQRVSVLGRREVLQERTDSLKEHRG